MQAVKWTTEGMRKGCDTGRVFHDVRIRQLQGICGYPEEGMLSWHESRWHRGKMSIYPSLTESISVKDVFMLSSPGMVLPGRLRNSKTAISRTVPGRSAGLILDRTSSTRYGTVREIAELKIGG